MSTRIPALRRLAAAAILGSPLLAAQHAPATDALAKLVPEGTVFYVQAPSLDRLGAAVTKIARLFKPESEKAPEVDDLLALMNLPGSAKEIDHQKPIGFSLVLPAEQGSEPIPMFFVPAKSPADFARSISGAHPKVATAIEGDYVCVSESSAVKHGTAAAPIALGLPPGELVARVDVKRIVDHYRPVIEMGLAQLEAAMASAPPKTVNGIDLKPILKMYMDGVRTFLDSGESLDFAVRLDGDRLEAASAMTMIEKSELAGFGSKEKTDARQLSRFVDPEASIQGVVGLDQAAVMKQFKPAMEAILSAYPEPLRSGFVKMMGSADELAAQLGSATCFSGDLGPAGLRFAIYLHPRDPAKFLAAYRKMLGAMPCATLDEPKEGEVDGVHVTRMRVHVDTKALMEGHGQGLPEKSNAELKTMLDKLYGQDGLALTFATQGDVTAIVIGGDDAFLRGAIARVSKAGKPTQSVARALDQVADMNPCFVLQYNLGKVMKGIGDLVGEQMHDVPLGIRGISATLTYAGGIDGRVWRGSISTDLAELGAAMRAMKGQGTSGVQRAKAQADVHAIASAVAEFAARNGGKYPDELIVLVTPDVNGQTYLHATRLPKDPWGRAYLYEAPAGGTAHPRVYSYGKDGKPGGAGEDADIEDWISSGGTR